MPPSSRPEPGSDDLGCRMSLLAEMEAPASNGQRLRLWGGRFAGGPAEALARLSVSVQFDWRLAPYDLAASRAHAGVLARAGLLDADELGRMLAALDDLEAACASGEFRPTVEDEDVHTALERGLLERLGTARRQAARRALPQRPGRHRPAALPARPRPGSGRAAGGARRRPDRAGRAAPGHARAGHDPPAARPAGHVRPPAARPRAAAAARPRPAARLGPPGGGLPARRGRAGRLRRCRWTRCAVARELGFTASAANSMDAVADRDFVAEFLFVTSLIGVHLSRLGEEVVLWTSQEFGWVELDDAFATGSSIMPQKKNADIAELARGKAGRLIGDLVTVLTMLKGLPLTYDRDLQEDKEPVFDAVDTLELVLPALAGMVATMEVRVDRLAAAAPVGLHARHRGRRLAGPPAACRSGRPTRSPGALVALCLARGCDLHEVDDDDLAAVSPHLDPGGPAGAVGPGRRCPPGPPRARPARVRSPTSSRPPPTRWPGGGSGRRESVVPR